MPELRKLSAVAAIVLILLIVICLPSNDPALAAPLGAPGESFVNYPVHPTATQAFIRPLTVIDGRIGRQPMYKVLVGCGIAPTEVLSLTRSFKGIFDFRKSRPKDEYQLYLTPQKKLQKLTYKAGVTDQYVAVRTGNGSFHTYRRPIVLEKEIVAKTFTIESSLYQAIIGKGENGNLVAAFVDIFSWDIDFYQSTRKGDTIRILFEKFSLDGQFIKYGKILAAQYFSNNHSFSAFYYEDDLQAGYYDEKGLPLRKMFLRVPVKFGIRTSSYSIKRYHPISKKIKRHTGIDYGAAHGTPIFATAAGTVEYAGWRGGYGKLVIIRHPNGYQTLYGHCSRLLVKKGSYVKQGQHIARVGRTGKATGPHVHYEIRVNGKPVNPNSLKSTKGKPLPIDQRAGFENIVQARLLLMANYLYSDTQPNVGQLNKLR